MFATQTQFGADDATQVAGAGATKQKVEEKTQVLAVTIRSIETAVANRKGDDEVLFHGIDPGMVVLVGAVETVSQQAASIELSINDSTGRIRLRQYGAEEGNPLATVEVGKYIIVAGQVRTSPLVHVTVMNARVVRSPDEISYHMIEAAHAALRLQRGPTDIMPTLSQPQKPVMMDTTTAQPAVSAAVVAAAAPAGVAAPSAVSDVRGTIVAYLQREGEGKAEGIGLSTICAQLKGTPESAVRSILTQLVDDGEAYTTIDDDHFAMI